MSYSFFKSNTEVLDYILQEIEATLKDDFERMNNKYEYMHYTSDDRAEMRARIDDIEQFKSRLIAVLATDDNGLIETITIE